VTITTAAGKSITQRVKRTKRLVMAAREVRVA
jgi:hypothetical protein